MNDESLETRIGSRWLLYVGIVAIVVGVACFEKLAFDSGWISELARVVQGGVVGALLVWAGMWFVRAGYPLYGQIVCGGGIAVLYVSTYAAFNFYHLIDRLVAVDLMYVITAAAAWLADRQRSPGLALMAVGGGFAAPLLLPSPSAAPLALFGYETILIAGTVVLAGRRGWPALNAVSYGFTILTMLQWGDRFYAPSMYLTVEAFLTLFCAMYLTISGPLAVRASAPILYYVASIAILAAYPSALLVFFIAMTVVAAVVSSRLEPVVRFVLWLSVALPLLVWCEVYGAPERLVVGLATVAAVYAMNLIAQTDVALLHLNGLGAYFAAHLLVDGVNPDATAALATGFAVWHGALAVFVARRSRDRAIQYAALGFKLLAIAIFLQFHGAAAIAGWAAEGAVVIWLGLREDREWLRLGGVALFVLSALRLVAVQFSSPPFPYVVLLNARTACAAFVINLTYALAWVHARRQNGRERSTEVAIAIVAAKLLLLSTISSEIDAYWASDGGTRFGREMTMSIAWALYATALVMLGLWRQYAPIRRLAIVVLTMTTLKVLTVDLPELDRLYRVASILGLGVALLATSYLYQRFRVLSRHEAQ